MNAEEIKRSLDVFHPDGALFEIRAISAKGNYSGYFTNVDAAVQEVRRLTDGNVYFVLNAIKPGCYSRTQRDKLTYKPKETTSDGDIERRQWLLIDVDSERVSGVSATDIEKEKSMTVANQVYTFLRQQGFSEPVCCDSGNGAHLLYKIAMVP